MEIFYMKENAIRKFIFGKTFLVHLSLAWRKKGAENFKGNSITKLFKFFSIIMIVVVVGRGKFPSSPTVLLFLQFIKQDVNDWPP